uniref:Ty3 transposon capsid-like protein domain-containing protein n=1 Tax=Chromera velia CCMP2878 TaxID=1169474 RepID=A0A0G4G268_9ALVE|eukprot:Cvel_19891.t1-p1 / transcript=Cvel_19891.t1 / gene=Cvel_19891 / organism=Chromera_velia_CCMP2878 / gene_product=hypothetical protein / transcript_product=hypothetical protein / location=Cvel_scaffold1746:11962-15074(-) / protein_length=404 / sequence_SO=supercontig / SO=protein_coding / is_pseudo=false
MVALEMVPKDREGNDEKETGRETRLNWKTPCGGYFGERGGRASMIQPESVQATVTSPAIVPAQSITASSLYYIKLYEAPALFSGVRAKLTRWLKDVEDFYKLEKVLDLDKVLVAKNRISQDLKEWFDLYKVEKGPFQNWESLKAALIEHYSDTLARQKARKDLKKFRCTGAGVDDYNKRFKPLVAKLKGRLIKEDIVEDYISGLPVDVHLETNKAHPVNLVIAMKMASELEVFLSGGEGPRGGARDLQRPSAFESGGESARRNSPLGQEEGPVLMDLCGREGVSDAASQGILLGSVQVPSLDLVETSLECGDSLAERTFGARRTMGDSVETSSRGDRGRAEVDTREIVEGLELHSRPPKHGHLWASHSGEGDAETVVPEEEEEVEGSRQVGEFERSTEVSRRMR